MQLIQCSKGHYFDRDKYTRCPYCEMLEKQPQVTVPLREVQPMENTAASARTEKADNPVTSPRQQQQAAAPVKPDSKERESVRSPSVAREKNSETPVVPESYPNNGQSISEIWRGGMQGKETNVNNQWNVFNDDNRTVSYYARTIGIEPVVGWLVAVEGEYFGEAFKLKSGRNFIGRSPEMDVQLSLDLSVSRRKHAVIIYEPKSKVFIAQPGDSRELFYLNEEVVLNNVTLKAYDVLTIGESKLLFIPLCNDKFNWDDAKRENKDK